MNITKKLPLIISFAALCAIVAFSGNKNHNHIKHNNNSTKELRAVWVTYMDLNMTDTDMTYSAFKKKFNNIADNAKKKKFNALVVQVRPFSDALYKSKYFPYSHILTGVQGKDPGYDPLKYMCSYCRKTGMQIHAWINPYRVRSTNTLRLSSDNPYKKDRTLGKTIGDGIYYNPALPEVRNLIEKGVNEIVSNYDVDGIQFDDYFYPTQDEDFDSAEFAQYTDEAGRENGLSLSEWRKTNVNILVAECYKIVHKKKSNAVFGISPQGNLENNDELYADVRSWCTQKGYVDYICPQLYWSLDNPALGFEEALNKWLKLKINDNVKLFVGIAGYKTGTESDDGTWNKNDKILQTEIIKARKRGVKGFMFYSYANLVSEKASREVANLISIMD